MTWYVARIIGLSLDPEEVMTLKYLFKGITQTIVGYLQKVFVSEGSPVEK